ncbi:MAG: cation-transporting P-type ATPase [Deltaproteobacteria bacterium]|nr:cation-transporting P-type ATPase [Deltaproteobacteria bacterium]
MTDRATGLSTAEVQRLRARHGPNVLRVPPPVPAWRVLLDQMVHFFALMLWVAAALAFVAGMPQLGMAITLIVVLNGVFAFVQEHRAERAAERLRDLLPRRVTVRRDGTVRSVDVTELVRGDIVLLGGGDRISADLRVIEAHGLSVDTSTMTGESVPATFGAGDVVFAGTFVVEGEAECAVVATGQATRLAGIARLTQTAHRPPSPLAREIALVVRRIALVAIGVGVGFFAIAVVLGLAPGEGFLFAIGVTVALVPEGLLPTVTLSLAVGAQRMAARHALVRRLDAVQTLGSTTFICTDKTGTLTQNEMSVVEAWTPRTGVTAISGSGYGPEASVDAPPDALPALRALADAALRCSNGRAVEHEGRWVAQGDPMEAAIDALARRVGVDRGARDGDPPVVRRFPFDPRRRRTSVVTATRVFVKGAPDALLPLVAPTPSDAREASHADGVGSTTPTPQHEHRDLGRGTMEEAAAQLDRMAARGLRVIAVASRTLDRAASGRESAREIERGLELVGLLGLEDPPRPAAAAAIAACRRAGIGVAMITGDHPATARAIAEQVGLLIDGSSPLQGSELPADDAALGALLDRDGVVVSRVTPEDKLRIARALRGRGHVVAMTGDGVNDGPALQEADIGIAMGRSGTDVAREASDLVLLDDDFATIVAAIEQGRATFANIRRFLTYHLTDNVSELTPFVLWALSGGRFPLALGVLAILCLDVGTDQLPALALGMEPARGHQLHEPPRGKHLIDRALLVRVFCVLGPVQAAIEMAAFAAVLLAAGWVPGGPLPPAAVVASASGAAFAVVVVGQMANAFACRSTHRPAWRLGLGSNRFLLWAVLAELAMLAMFLFVPPIARLLGIAPPPAIGWWFAAAAAPAMIVADLAHKKLRARRAAAAAA